MELLTETSLVSQQVVGKSQTVKGGGFAKELRPE
jgi:hypothetical protein